MVGGVVKSVDGVGVSTGKAGLGYPGAHVADVDIANPPWRGCSVTPGLVIDLHIDRIRGVGDVYVVVDHGIDVRAVVGSDTVPRLARRRQAQVPPPEIAEIAAGLGTELRGVVLCRENQAVRYERAVIAALGA